jgi:hypothetical protein
VSSNWFILAVTPHPALSPPREEDKVRGEIFAKKTFFRIAV